MKALAAIQKTREYLDYLEEHITNVHKAWIEVSAKCARQIVGFEIQLENDVFSHDMSKLGEHEFVQYRDAFFPCDGEEKKPLGEAWAHHKQRNPHHWERWTLGEWSTDAAWKRHCAHMVIDWTAMGYKFGDTAEEYYKANKDKIHIPAGAAGFLCQMFAALRPTS